MALEDTLGATYSPQQAVSDQTGSDAGMVGAQYADENGTISPQAVVSGLLQRHLRGRQIGGPANQFFGGGPSDDPSKYVGGAPSDDPSKYAIPPQTTEGERPVEPSSTVEGDVSYAAREAAQAAVKGVGGAMAGAAEVGVPGYSGVAESPVPADLSMANKPGENRLTKAGNAVKKWAEENIPVTPEERAAHPFIGTAARAIGGMAPALAAGAVGGPLIGGAAAAMQFGLSSYDETYQDAKAKGADETTARGAASVMAAATTAIGGLPVASVLSRFAPETWGFGMRVLAEAAANGAVFTTVGEAQEIIGQQIAKSYDKDAGYKFDPYRLAGEFAAGALLGGGAAALHGRPEQQPQPGTGLSPGAGAAPGAEPGAVPPGGGPAGGETGGQAGAAPGAPPQAERNKAWRDYWSTTEPPDAEELAKRRQQKPSVGAKSTGVNTMSNLYNVMREQYGFSDADLTNASKGDMATFAREAAFLRANGYSHADIVKMSPIDMQEAADQVLSKMHKGAPRNEQAQPGPQAQPVPETEDTLKAQQDQLVKGERPAQMFPKGTPELNLPQGMARHVDANGNIWHYNTQFINYKAIDQAVATGQENQILGLGPFNKADVTQSEAAGHPVVAVTERTPDGTEVRGAAGTQQTAPVQAAVMEQGKSPGNTVSVENAQALIAQRKGENKMDWNGIPISIEAHTGGARTVTMPTGEQGQQRFPITHGEIPGTKGADGDPVDAYVGPGNNIYVLDEKHESGSFRQHKAFLGFNSPGDALRAYVGTQGKVPTNIGGMRQMSLDEFKEWMKGDLTRPASEAMTRAHDVIMAPGPEPIQPHIQAIEDAIRAAGGDPRNSRPATIQRAAEIHEHEGLSPTDSFQLAVVRNAVDDGLLTPDQVRQLYGEEIYALLGPQQPPERGVSAPTPGATVGGPRAPHPGGGVQPGGENGVQRPQGTEGGQAPGTKEPVGGEAGGVGGGAAVPEPVRQPVTVGGERAPGGAPGRPGGEAAGGNAPEPKPTENAPEHAVKRAQDLYDSYFDHLDQIKGEMPGVPLKEYRKIKEPLKELLLPILQDYAAGKTSAQEMKKAFNDAYVPFIQQSDVMGVMTGPGIAAYYNFQLAHIAIDDALANAKIPREKIPHEVYRDAINIFLPINFTGTPLEALERALIKHELDTGILTPEDLKVAGATDEEVNAITEGPSEPGKATAPGNAGAAEAPPEHAEAGGTTPGAGTVVGGEGRRGQPEGTKPAEPEHPERPGEPGIVGGPEPTGPAQPEPTEPAEQPPVGVSEPAVEPAGHEPTGGKPGEPVPEPGPKPVKSDNPVVQSLLDAAKSKAPIARVLKAMKSGEEYDDAIKGEASLPKIVDNKKLFPTKPSKKDFEEAARLFDERTVKGKFQDTGHIGGARKDKWIQRGLQEDDLDDMTGAERAKYVTKNYIWPRPDYEDLVDNQGVDAQAAYLIKRIYDRMAAKPRDADEQIDYIRAVRKVRELAEAAKTVDHIDDLEKAFRDAFDDSRSLERMIRQKRHTWSPLYISWQDKSAAEDAVKKEGFPHLEPWQRMFLIHEYQAYDKNAPGGYRTTFTIKTKGETKWPTGVERIYSDRDKAVEAVKKVYEEWLEENGLGKNQPKRPHLDFVERTGPAYRGANGRDIDDSEEFKTAFGFRDVEFGNWAAGDERQRLVNFAYDGLHDLARAWGVPPKALSMNGRLALAFGSRGTGGKNAAAAHYEPDRIVINLTKMHGAGSLAHEMTHVLDHAFGEALKRYSGAPVMASGGRTVGLDYSPSGQRKLPGLSGPMVPAFNHLMHTIKTRMETPEEKATRIRYHLHDVDQAIEKWGKKLEEAKAEGNPRTVQALTERLKLEENRRENIIKKTPDERVWSEYYRQAVRLSGKAGENGYWARPEELLARAAESWVQDKIEAEGHKSQYLVHGTEHTTHAMHPLGNPYPGGEERKAINRALDEFFHTLTTVQEHPGDSHIPEIVGKSEGEWKPLPPPAETTTDVESGGQAVDGDGTNIPLDDKGGAAHQPAILADHFAKHFVDGGKFDNILAARKFAKEKGFDYDEKMVEEALELGIVKLSRDTIDEYYDPTSWGNQGKHDTYDKLVMLYNQMPRLGTRTSTSVRDQAYSTPPPLAFLVNTLAKITNKSTVFEPTAGNGALLIGAEPGLSVANELNPARAENLRHQGFVVRNEDAANDDIAAAKAFDVVVTNPPFGTVKGEDGRPAEFDLSKIQPGYTTTQIDHAIALRALGALKEGSAATYGNQQGRAVLILGGISKLKATPEERKAGYSTQDKRYFFKALYDRFNVTDHFTVDGDLYAKQGASWPVDVVVINGRGKSALPLPALGVPRIYKSWEELKDVLDNPRNNGLPAGPPNETTVEPKPEPAGGYGGGGKPPRGPRPAPEPQEPGELHPEPVPGGPGGEHTGAGGGEGAPEPGSSGEPTGTGGGTGAGEQPPGLGDSDDDLESAFDDGLDEIYGPKTPSEAVLDEAHEDGGIAATMGEDRAPPFDVAKDPEAAKEWTKGYDEQNEGVKTAPSAPRPHKAGEPTGPGPIETPHPDKDQPFRRPSAEEIKELFGNVSDAADKAMGALVEMFGGGKSISMGVTFDKDTYEKAKPKFKEAAESLYRAGMNARELLNRLQAYMEKVWGLAREALERMKPYLLQFVKDVRDGLIKLVKTPEQEPVFERGKAEKKEKETELQVHYDPESNATPMDVLAPKNIADGMNKALKQITKEKGDIDRWVADTLGVTPEELKKALSAEQIDGVAIITRNMQRESAAILGDQTGMGKGRQIASAMVYALKNGYVPIFVTEKPNLYADIYRDLVDVGIEKILGRKLRPLMTNQKEDIPLEEAPTDPDAPPAVVLKKSMGTKANLDRFRTAEDFKKEHDILFTTYNQMQTINGDTHRRQLIRRLAPHAIIIFDESHNAGGQKGRNLQPANPLLVDRATFARQIQGPAKGVAYSSATYAKRADVMDLYLKTNMSKAVSDIKNLGPAISKGGIPMQQVVAAMLAADGQYIRRERSFDGINFLPKEVDVNRDRYNDVAMGMQHTNRFSISDARARAIQKIKDEIAGEGGHVGGENQVQDSVTSINFTSVMHNLVNQMLLAMKAEPTAKIAIEALKNGQKPFITFANTMESFLSQTAKDLDLRHGDIYKGDFRDVMKRYLERTRILKITRAHAPKGAEPELRRITDEELGPEGVALFQRAYNHIDGIQGLEDLPVSPIDSIKQHLIDAGYKVGEITGRKMTLDYTDRKNPKLAPRKTYEVIIDGKKRKVSETSIVGRNKTVADFNNGDLDAILANQSGATGLSAHASEKFKDQRQRHMITAQPEGNIDTQMQMYGRVHRTGQVVLPTYTHVAANIPAETRPTAVLMKKLASLNANTTGARTGAFTMNVPDFLNPIGDKVAAQWVLDNPEEHHAMGDPVEVSEDTGRPKVEDAMRILTGKTMLLSVDKQEQMMDELITGYNDALEAAEAAGENTIEAKTLDLKATPMEQSMVVPQRDNSGSLFAQPVYVRKVMANRLGKSWPPEEVMRRVVEPLSDYVPPDTRPGMMVPGEYTPVRSMTRQEFNDRWHKNWAELFRRDNPGKELPEKPPLRVDDPIMREHYDKHFENGYFGPYQAPEKQPIPLTPETHAQVLADLDDQRTYDINPLRRRAMDLAKSRENEWVAKYMEYRQKVLDEIEDATAQERKRTQIDGIKDRWTALNNAMLQGSRVTLMFGGKDGGRERGVVTSVDKVTEPLNPLSLGSWKVTFALPTPSKQISLPFSRLWRKGNANPDDDMAVEYEPINRYTEDAAATLKLFKDSQAETRKERYIITGNLLAGYDWTRNQGLISHYTDDKGRIQQGILMPERWNFAKHAAGQPTILRDPEEILKWIRDHRPQVMSGEDDRAGPGVIRINAGRFDPNEFLVDITAAKKKGGAYYLDPDLISAAGGDFVSQGGFMRKRVRGEDAIKAVIARMQELGARFGITAAAPKAEPVPPEMESPKRPMLTPGQPGDVPQELWDTLSPEQKAAYQKSWDPNWEAGSIPKGWDKAELEADNWYPFANETPEQRTELMNQLRWLINQMTGGHVRTEFSEVLPVKKDVVGYGAMTEGRPVGTYNLVNRLIKIAINDPRGLDRGFTALHEGWHAIQDLFLTDQEKALLKREMPRLRKIVAERLDRNVGEMADFEVEANAFGLYSADRASSQAAGMGMHIGIRGIFERIWQLLRRLGNWLRGHGFQTAEDIFGKGLEGELGERAPRETSGLREEGQKASTRETLQRALATKPSEELASMYGPKNYGNAPVSKRIRQRLSDLLLSKGARTKLIENLQDFNVRWAQYQHDIESRGYGWMTADGKTPDEADFYEMKRLFPGKRNDRYREFEENHLRPLDAFMRQNDISQEEASDWLQAKAARDRNLNVGRRYEQSQDFFKAMSDDNITGGSGWSNKEAADHIAQVMAGNRAPAFQELSKRVRDIVNWINRERLRGGLEDLKTIQEWARSEPNYVPFTSWEDPSEAHEHADQGFPSRGAGGVRGPEVKAALGRSTRADNSLVSLLDQAQRTVDRAERNLAYNSMAELLAGVPRADREKDGIYLNKGRPVRKIDPQTGLVYTDNDYADRFKENTVWFKRNGQSRFITFDDPRLAEAAKRWAPHSNVFTQYVGRFTNRWKSLLTHYNPEFLLRHAARYYIEGALNQVEELDPDRSKGNFGYSKYLKQSIPLFGEASRAIWNVERGRDTGQPMEEYYKRMRAAGGATGMMAMRDYDVALQRLSSAASMVGKSEYNPRKLAQELSRVVDHITAMIDNSIRLAAFAGAIRQGKSDQKAAIAAREATVDYNLRGLLANWIGAFQPFQNVATQTGTRMAKAQMRSRYMRRIFGAVIGMGFAMAAWNYMFGGDDKDKTAFFDKLPEWTKIKSMALFAGLSDSKGRPQPIWVPMPYNYALPMTLGYVLAGMMFGTRKAGYYGGMLLKSALSTFTTVGEEEAGIRTIVPNAVRPFADLAENKSWTGGHIHTDPDSPYRKKVPDSEAGFPWTPDFWKTAAKYLNWMSLGGPNKAGWLDIYPEDLEYLTKAYAGGQERLIENLGKTGASIIKGEAPTPSDIPMSRVLYGADYDKADQARNAEIKRESKTPWKGAPAAGYAPPLFDLSRIF